MSKNADGPRRQREETGCLHGPEPRIHGLLQGWLLLLLAERENHGYELMRQLSSELPEDMVPDTGVVYRMLRKLEQEGAVGSTLRPGSGGPARKVYFLTAAGRLRLKEWQGTAMERIVVIERFLSRLSEATTQAPQP